MSFLKGWDNRLLATLAAGILATEGQSPGNICLLLILLALALLAQEKVLGKKPQALDSLIRKKNEFSDKIYYRGSLLDPDTKNIREKHYLMLTCGGEKQVELRGVFLGFAFIYGFIAIKMPWASLTLTSFVQFVAILTLISRASRSHSLVALGTSALAASFGFYKAGGHVNLAYVVYVFFFFWTFFSFHIDRKAKVSEDFKPALLATVAFLAIHFVLDKILPEHHFQPQAFSRLAQNDSGVGLSRLLGNEGGGSGSGSGSGPGSAGGGRSQGQGSGGQGAKPGSGQGTKEGGQSSDHDGGNPASQKTSGNDGDNRAPSGRQGLDSKQGHGDPRQNNGTITPQMESSASESGDGGGGQSRGSESDSVTSESGDTPLHKLPELKLPEDFLKKVLWIAGGALALYFLYRVLFPKKKKAVSQKRPPLPPEVRDELLSELKAVATSPLSARDKIIKQYLLFLKIMEAAEHPREAFVPPRDYITELNVTFPQQSTSFNKLTEVYSDTFYGNLSVGAEDVCHYDKAFNSVVTYFLKSA